MGSGGRKKKKNEEEKELKSTKTKCRYCTYAIDGPKDALLHSAVHAIATEDIEEPEYCPLCFGPAKECPIYLSKATSKNNPQQPLVFCGTYAESPEEGVKFSAKSLQKSTLNAPSTNHPVVCPACNPELRDKKRTAVWSYNMHAHWARVHHAEDMRSEQWSELREDIKITTEEKDRLRKLQEKHIK